MRKTGMSIHHCSDLNHKVDLVDVELHKDETLGYCIGVVYRIETPGQIRELRIPKIRLGINPHELNIETWYEEYGFGNGVVADVGFGECEVYEEQRGHYYTDTIIETKTKEMTLEEIEKKLGHKVKIVNR